MRLRLWVCVGGGWVEFGRSAIFDLSGLEGLARCWVLRRHPVDVFSGRVRRGSSNARRWGSCLLGVPDVGVGGGDGCGGVWLFVECCIVDASILLW